MKKTRKFAAMFATMAIAACSVAPAVMNTSATNVTVNTTKDNAEHTYSAYQIFTGEYTKNGLTINGWGTEYNYSAENGLLADNAFTSLVITPAQDGVEATTVGDFIGDSTDAAKVAQAIEKLGYTSESAQADALATILAKYVNGAATTLSGNATDLTAGYWIVLDSYTTSANDAVSKIILRVSGKEDPIIITPKKDYPTVLKKVQENVKTPTDDFSIPKSAIESAVDVRAKWNDVADYNIGDAVPFKLYGSMPSKLGDYTAYYYKFTDTLGSQFDQPQTVTINIETTTLTANWDSTNSKYNITGETGTNCRVTWDSTNNQLVISFEDIKAYSNVTSNTIVTVEYTAVLNNTAVIGLMGQENKVDLTYSNNPNIKYEPNTDNDEEDVPKDDNGTPDNPNDDTDATDKTPEDKVIVFTYELDMTKVDSATDEPLEGAEFTLSRGEGDNIEYVKVNNNNIVTGWGATGSTLTTDASGICKIIGLDDGTYTLTETTTPNGYNTISPITFKIDATTANNQTWDGNPASALTAITLTNPNNSTHFFDDSASLDNDIKEKFGTVKAKILNDKGIDLPETGGMGTKLFIAGGGLTATLAAVYLVSKKRSREE